MHLGHLCGATVDYGGATASYDLIIAFAGGKRAFLLQCFDVLLYSGDHQYRTQYGVVHSNERRHRDCNG